MHLQSPLLKAVLSGNIKRADLKTYNLGKTKE